LKFRKFRICLLVLLPFLALFCQTTKRDIEKPAPSVVFPDGFTVEVSLAVTDQERALGLMYVSSLADDRGMLFLFSEDSKNPFWMKNCLISLDMIWLDDAGKIVDISSNVEPCAADPCPNYFPSAPYRMVLEVRGNLAREHKLAAGDKLVVIGMERQK
jgi:uncharacterized protein